MTITFLCHGHMDPVRGYWMNTYAEEHTISLADAARALEIMSGDNFEEGRSICVLEALEHTK